MRRGTNKPNLNYWRNEIFIKLHGLSSSKAETKARIICLSQDNDLLRHRIIKLEKLFKKINP